MNSAEPLFQQQPARSKISIDSQIECAQRELSMRTAVYPKQVRSGKISERLAEQEIQRMDAIISTLKWCRDHRSLILKIKQQEGEEHE